MVQLGGLLACLLPIVVGIASNPTTTSTATTTTTTSTTTARILNATGNAAATAAVIDSLRADGTNYEQRGSSSAAARKVTDGSRNDIELAIGNKDKIEVNNEDDGKIGNEDLDLSNPHLLHISKNFNDDERGPRKARSISYPSGEADSAIHVDIHEGTAYPDIREDIKEWGRWDEREARKLKGSRGKRRRHRLRHGKRRHDRGNRELLDTDISFGSYNGDFSYLKDSQGKRQSISVSSASPTLHHSVYEGEHQTYFQNGRTTVESFDSSHPSHRKDFLSNKEYMKQDGPSVVYKKNFHKLSSEEMPLGDAPIKASKGNILPSSMPAYDRDHHETLPKPSPELGDHNSPTNHYWSNYYHNINQGSQKQKQAQHQDLKQRLSFSPLVLNPIDIESSEVTIRTYSSAEWDSPEHYSDSNYGPSVSPKSYLSQEHQEDEDNSKLQIHPASDMRTNQNTQTIRSGGYFSHDRAKDRKSNNKPFVPHDVPGDLNDDPSSTSVSSNLLGSPDEITIKISQSHPAQGGPKEKESKAISTEPKDQQSILLVSPTTLPPSVYPYFSSTLSPSVSPNPSPSPPTAFSPSNDMNRSKYLTSNLQKSATSDGRTLKDMTAEEALFQSLIRSSASGVAFPSLTKGATSQNLEASSTPGMLGAPAALTTASGTCYSTNDIIVVIFLTSLVNMVIFLGVTLGLCWCSLRGRIASSASRAAMRADDQRTQDTDDETEVPVASEGCLEACLPDISYQRHIARGSNLRPTFVMGRALRPLMGHSNTPRLSHAVHDLLHNLKNSPDYQLHKKKLSKSNRRSLSLENLALT